MLPLQVLLLLALALVPAAGTLVSIDADCDGVPDDSDAWVGRCAAAPVASPAIRHVTLVLVTRAPNAENASTVSALAPRFTRAWSDATRGTGAIVIDERVVVLPAPRAAESLEDAPVTLTALAFLGPDAPRDADALVFLSRELPTGGRCGCVAWSARVEDPTVWGAPAHYRATLAIGSPDAPEDELAYRFVHELAHASCCRLVGVGASLVDGAGHWRTGFDPIDPMSGDGSISRASVPRFSDATLVLLGLEPAARAAPIPLASGASLSGADLLALSR